MSTSSSVVQRNWIPQAFYLVGCNQCGIGRNDKANDDDVAIQYNVPRADQATIT